MKLSDCIYIEKEVFACFVVLFILSMIAILLFAKSKYGKNLCERVKSWFSNAKSWLKEFPGKIKDWFKKCIGEIRTCLGEKERKVEKKDSGYASLIPYKYKQWDESFNALHWALKQPKVNNIAITGYLGSGKSSFWESYKYRVGRKYPDDNPLKDVGIVSISLAKFHRICENQNESKEQEKTEIEIERGILEQILYSVDSEDIPASRFKKLHEMPKKLQYGYSLVVYVLVVCCFVFTKYDKLSLLLKKTESLKDILFMDSFYVWFIFLIVLLLCLLVLMPRLYMFRITSISCHKIDIHFEKNKGGLFSQNMTELVYFFEKLNKRIVVIEDLERFDSPVIFIKLRELNHILNRVPSIKNLKFIYMIRDDTFLKYERTKFFDFIVPIVPVLTKDNSADFILRKMSELEIELGRPYIKYISKYLSDLRLLKNCKNEYFVYKQVNMEFLKEKNSDSMNQKECQRIFSLILYKNLYPRDFQKLLRHKGILYYLLNDVMDDYLKKQEEIKNA